MSEEHHNLIPNHSESSANASNLSREASMPQEPEACNETAATTEVIASDRSCALTSLGQDDNDSSQGETTANAELGEQHDLRESIELKSIERKSALVRVHQRRRLFKAWWLETLACVVSLAALLALFGILYHYKNRPSPDWPVWMSLNTIVSALVVVLKTSALLVLSEGIGQLKWTWFTNSSQPLEHVQMWDDATRGPLGAVVLLGRLHGRDLLASLGALVIVLMLIVDPFAQQIIHYKDCAILLSGSAKLPRTNNFEGGRYYASPLTESIGLGVQSAIDGGIFNPQPYAGFECETGNCTWSIEYSTVAWCSACHDISDQLIITKSPNSTQTDATAIARTGHLLNTSVPDGISISLHWGASSITPWTFAAMGPAPGDVAANSIDFITGAKPPEPCNDTSFAGVWSCKGPEGFRCSFFPCVKTFNNASVVSGRLTETLLDVGTAWSSDAGGFGYYMLDLTCSNSSGEQQALKSLGYKIGNGQRFAAFNTSDNDTLSSSFVRQNCLYVIDKHWQHDLIDYLQILLNGTVTGYDATTLSPQGYLTGPQIVQSIFNFGNANFESVEGTFRNISTAVTNYMRDNGSPFFQDNGTKEYPPTPAIGITKQYKICIGVRWGWLAYPATLVLLTLIFFGLLLAATCPKTSHARIWKSSPLALLYHGLASWDPEQLDDKALNHLDEAKDMMQIAKSTSVRLEDTPYGVVHFVEQRKVNRQLI